MSDILLAKLRFGHPITEEEILEESADYRAKLFFDMFKKGWKWNKEKRNFEP